MVRRNTKHESNSKDHGAANSVFALSQTSVDDTTAARARRVPAELRGDYAVPLAEKQRHAWGRLDGATELAILRDWVEKGFQQCEPNKIGAANHDVRDPN